MASPVAPTLTTTTLLKRAAAKFPSRRAVAVPGKLALRYAELDALTDAAAARLADAGILPGHVVTLSFPNTLEGVIMFQAVMRAGAVAMPLDPDYTEQQFETYLCDSKTDLLITGVEGNAAAQAAAAKVGVVHATATVEGASSGPVVHIAGLPVAEAHDGNGNAGFSINNDPRDVALLLYYPCKIQLTHGDLVADIRSVSRLTETDALVVRLPLFHDPVLLSSLLAHLASGASVTLPGPDLAIIVGAGPSGLAVAACLREKGAPFVLLERDNCIAPLWHKPTYEGFKLQLPKTWFRELPLTPFPDDCPEEYPTALQYNHYLERYADRHDIKPEFNRTVLSARYDATSGLWRVRAADTTGAGEIETEYVGRWIVVATGEHADMIVPDIPGLAGFAGEVTHIGDYKSGEPYCGKRVLVVGAGCGNSGVEVALDLCAHGARTAVAARDAGHILLPRNVFGKPTLKVAAVLLDCLERWLPVRIVDKAKGRIARAVLGDLAGLGVRAPVFDCGDLERIRAGDIAVVPAVSRFGAGQVEFVDGRAFDIDAVVPAVARFGAGQVEFVDGRAFEIDAVVLATGYRSNLPQATWHGRRNGYPAIAFPYGWDGHCGLYAVGFSRRSFGGASTDDAVRVAEEIAGTWRDGTEPAGGQRDRNGVHIVF